MKTEKHKALSLKPVCFLLKRDVAKGEVLKTHQHQTEIFFLFRIGNVIRKEAVFLLGNS